MIGPECGRPVFDPQQGKIFSLPLSRSATDPTQLPLEWVPGLKLPEREIDHSSPFVPKLRIRGLSKTTKIIKIAGLRAKI